MAPEERLLRGLDRRLKELEAEILDRPPSDYTTYRSSVARREEVKKVIEMAKKILSGKEAADEDTEGDRAP